ncbi:MAG: hypothetical protein JO131_02985 [Gammaproteobacteria bacterium]|nr:hypothetical protein [Gammaproteobacteria bacterium]
MLSKKTLYSIIYSIILFFVILQNTNALIMTENNLKQMPQYTATFKFPSNPISSTGTLVLRFYQAFGDGSRTGWQTSITTPIVTYQGNVLPISTFFSYQNDNYLYGSYGLGYDQFAQYYGAFFAIAADQESTLTITGTFQQVAYLSATIYLNGTQVELLDKEMNVATSDLNPYIKNHPSVFAYSVNSNLFKLPSIENNSPLKSYTFDHPFTDPKIGKIHVYRLDQEESKEVVADDIAPDGCSRAYLFAQKASSQEMIILRIKVPQVFINNNQPDKIFHQYQTRYLSIGSHQMWSNIFLDFWTVNAEMLKDYMDEKGYAYVFFASNDYTKQLALQQKTPPTNLLL